MPHFWVPVTTEEPDSVKAHLDGLGLESVPLTDAYWTFQSSGPGKVRGLAARVQAASEGEARALLGGKLPPNAALAGD